MMGDLEEQLKLAGLISQDDIKAKALEQEKEEKKALIKRLEAGRESGTVEGITEYYLSKKISNQSFIEIIKWAEEWYDELLKAGHENLLDDKYITPIRQNSKPITEKEVLELEKKLGFKVPTSYKTFLLEIGGLNYGRLMQTLSPNEIVENKNFEELINIFKNDIVDFEPYLETLELLPIQDTDGNYDFILCNTRDESNEAFIYFLYHDECHLYGGQSNNMYDWLVEKMKTVMLNFAEL